MPPDAQLLMPFAAIRLRRCRFHCRHFHYSIIAADFRHADFRIAFPPLLRPARHYAIISLSPFEMLTSFIRCRSMPLPFSTDTPHVFEFQPFFAFISMSAE
jgi:hypothetical protein